MSRGCLGAVQGRLSGRNFLALTYLHTHAKCILLWCNIEQSQFCVNARKAKTASHGGVVSGSRGARIGVGLSQGVAPMLQRLPNHG
jgi:hypothetical protein